MLSTFHCTVIQIVQNISGHILLSSSLYTLFWYFFWFCHAFISGNSCFKHVVIASLDSFIFLIHQMHVIALPVCISYLFTQYINGIPDVNIVAKLTVAELHSFFLTIYSTTFLRPNLRKSFWSHRSFWLSSKIVHCWTHVVLPYLLLFQLLIHWPSLSAHKRFIAIVVIVFLMVSLSLSLLSFFYGSLQFFATRNLPSPFPVL